MIRVLCLANFIVSFSGKNKKRYQIFFSPIRIVRYDCENIIETLTVIQIRRSSRRARAVNKIEKKKGKQSFQKVHRYIVKKPSIVYPRNQNGKKRKKKGKGEGKKNRDREQVDFPQWQRRTFEKAINISANQRIYTHKACSAKAFHSYRRRCRRR